MKSGEEIIAEINDRLVRYDGLMKDPTSSAEIFSMMKSLRYEFIHLKQFIFDGSDEQECSHEWMNSTFPQYDGFHTRCKKCGRDK